MSTHQVISVYSPAIPGILALDDEPLRADAGVPLFGAPHLGSGMDQEI